MTELTELTDREKLNRYYDLVSKKHKKKKQFDNVEIKIHGNTMIREHWSNDENLVTKTWAFPFSMIDHFITELEKNGKAKESS